MVDGYGFYESVDVVNFWEEIWFYCGFVEV